jgi:hypothetical protein
MDASVSCKSSMARLVRMALARLRKSVPSWFSARCKVRMLVPSDRAALSIETFPVSTCDQICWAMMSRRPVSLRISTRARARSPTVSSECLGSRGALRRRFVSKQTDTLGALNRTGHSNMSSKIPGWRGRATSSSIRCGCQWTGRNALQMLRRTPAVPQATCG